MKRLLLWSICAVGVSSLNFLSVDDNSLKEVVVGVFFGGVLKINK